MRARILYGADETSTEVRELIRQSIGVALEDAVSIAQAAFDAGLNAFSRNADLLETPEE